MELNERMSEFAGRETENGLLKVVPRNSSVVLRVSFCRKSFYNFKDNNELFFFSKTRPKSFLDCTENFSNIAKYVVFIAFINLSSRCVKLRFLFFF